MKWRIKVTMTVEADTKEQAVAKADAIVPSDIPRTVERVEQCTEPRTLASDLVEDR